MCDLKTWNTEAVLSGVVPPIGSLHFTIFRISPSQCYLATCQGWNTACNLENIKTGASITTMASHGGFMIQVVFSKDSSKFISVDTGHTGAYQVS